MIDWLNALAGFLVGAVVGVTGVGGGSLMSPILILLFGIAPGTAVGTDLWFAAITKSVGGAIHHRQDSADLQIVKRLLIGSVPATLLTLLFVFGTGAHQAKNGVIVDVLGAALIVTSLLTVLRKPVLQAAARLRIIVPGRVYRYQGALTALAGAILGVLVTLTSVGAGALGATMLMALYPLRLTAKRLVGTDIVHAVPLTFLGGLGYLFFGSVDSKLLLSLLVGSIPGIILGSRASASIPEWVVRPLLALVLLISGVKLLW